VALLRFSNAVRAQALLEQSCDRILGDDGWHHWAFLSYAADVVRATNISHCRKLARTEVNQRNSQALAARTTASRGSASLQREPACY
jgi:hypothetical protein